MHVQLCSPKTKLLSGNYVGNERRLIMPRKLSNALTPLSVRNAKRGRHADGGGLHLLVKESGARSWVYRFMLTGKARDIGLGAASGPEAVSLAKARDKADAFRLKVKSGIDPLAERDREAAEALAAAQASQIAGITFKAVADAHIAANEANWRNAKHRQQWSNTLSTYVYPIVGDLPVAEICTAHVLKILEPIVEGEAGNRQPRSRSHRDHLGCGESARISRR
jgi:hypothetical protein